eukprot:CAMPEP_0184481054 /NCGR_PEP_ID=MMETSP0113_2-20130426/2604_1 /TAXON_ID=91329 /ORGANISM="Norrisiella sphaerica, Strain BC52" /LENGTH=340 /DNA_ID=CAMNT_0026859953 /DNA_START=243 /DNA_END=1262 /DNA_ORIENTATION=-
MSDANEDANEVVAAGARAIVKLFALPAGSRTVKKLQRLVAATSSPGGDGESSEGNGIQEMVEALAVIPDILLIPDWFGSLEDLRMYEPANAAAIETKAKAFDSLSLEILKLWNKALVRLLTRFRQKEDRKQVSEVIKRIGIPKSVIAACSFLSPSSAWTAYPEEAEKVLKNLSEIKLLTQGSDVAKSGRFVFFSFASQSRSILKELNRWPRKDKSALVRFAPVFRALILKIHHPQLSEVFGELVFADILRLIDQTHVSLKATGLEILAHCIPELLLTELRFHSPLLLDRVRASIAFHQVEIERHLYVCISKLLTRVDPNDRHTRDIGMDLMGSVVKEIEW